MLFMYLGCIFIIIGSVFEPIQNTLSGTLTTIKLKEHSETDQINQLGWFAKLLIKTEAQSNTWFWHGSDMMKTQP